MFQHLFNTQRALFVATLIFSGSFSGQALAQCCNCQSTAQNVMNSLRDHVRDQHNDTRQHITDEHDTTRDHIDTEHQATLDWIEDVWWEEHIQTALADMADELSTVGLAQVASIGGFFDAQNHVQSQRVLNVMKAEAHNKYKPSASLCVFGTSVRSLAATEVASQNNREILLKRSLDRQLGNGSSSGSEFGHNDRTQRLLQFKSIYCNPQDNMGTFDEFCEFDKNDIYGNANAPINNRMNNDIDYTRFIDSRKTIDIDFSDNTDSNDEVDLIALANNLYAHDLMFRPQKDRLLAGQNQDVYMGARALVAKRNVAENSFYTIAAMKSRGTMSDTRYIGNALRNMGMDGDDLIAYLGNNPSYYAQMEVLTKKLYQNPQFFINLIDSPENVDRQHAAMQSFELMQQRDIFESFMRSEMLLSILVEMELEELQLDVERVIDGL